jgi:hypothetical protein
MNNAEGVVELIVKLRETMKRAYDWAERKEGSDGSGLMVQCADRLGTAARALEARTPSPEAVMPIEALEQIISAWTFAHDVDGAARNDLFARLRTAAPPAPVQDDDAEWLRSVFADERDRLYRNGATPLVATALHRLAHDASPETIERIASRLSAPPAASEAVMVGELIEALEAIKDFADADETQLCWETANAALVKANHQIVFGAGQ